MYFNVFEAAPENERDGPSQQAAQNASKVSTKSLRSALFWLTTKPLVQLPEYFFRYCMVVG